MAKLNDPTLREVFDDLVSRAHIRFQKIGKFYGIDCPKDFNVHESPIGQDIPVYYEYAFEARMPRGCMLYDWGNEEGFKILEESIGGSTEDGGNSASGPAYDLVQLVKARRALDKGDRLSIKQIALLARMTEKSVCNALYANGTSRLKGASANVSDTLVENHEALSWLKGRRSFRETSFPKFDEQLPERLSYAEISRYIDERLNKLYGKPGANYFNVAIKLLGWENDIHHLQNIFRGASAINPRDCENLAKVLKIDAAWFTEQVMRALYPREMELALMSAQGKKPQSDEGNNKEKHQEKTQAVNKMS